MFFFLVRHSPQPLFQGPIPNGPECLFHIWGFEVLHEFTRRKFLCIHVPEQLRKVGFQVTQKWLTDQTLKSKRTTKLLAG